MTDGSSVQLRVDVGQPVRGTRIVMHLLVLAFGLPDELRVARWAEFECDLERAEWRIPAERIEDAPAAHRAAIALGIGLAAATNRPRRVAVSGHDRSRQTDERKHPLCNE